MRSLPEGDAAHQDTLLASLSSDSNPGGPVVIIGAGAAGLATAIFLRRANSRVDVVVLDGARRPGSKILVSGGSRCNVTNSVVSDADFQGGPRSIVRRILRALPVPETVTFFRGIGVPLHEEPGGKLFPDSNKSRDVLEALLEELAHTGSQLRADHRVLGIEREQDGFRIASSHGELHARFVVVATGGLSLPKTGSDGAGYMFARALGHSIVAQTPALVPLILEGGFHAGISGVSHDVTLDLWVDRRRLRSISGALLWTHFGVSGPVVLDASRFWLRAQVEKQAMTITARLCGVMDDEDLDEYLKQLTATHPRASLQNALAKLLPAAVAAAVLDALTLDASTTLAHLTREDRRRLSLSLTAWPLRIRDSRGYNYAEVTAGGVPLTEIDPATMQSRVCDGLYLTGEILDVDGRIGGFNFQWAWCTGCVAGRAIGRRVAGENPRDEPAR
jgi:predicted Rossmann fold flavoprotein